VDENVRLCESLVYVVFVSENLQTKENLLVFVNLAGKPILFSMMTDPIADMLTRIRNAAAARKRTVLIPLSKVKKAIAPDGTDGDEFGISVAINEDYALVGLELEDYPAPSQFEWGVSNGGAVYLFHKTNTGAWSYPTQISASDKASGDHFGNSVSISGDHFMVGSVWDSYGSGQTTQTAAGSAYFFGKSTVGIEEIKGNETFRVYPNPSSGIFNVLANDVDECRVYDAMGKLVYQEQLNTSVADVPTPINLSMLASGMYTCELRSNDKVLQGQIIIER